MTSATHYFVPAEPVEIITEIKRSRFIAHIAHCSNTNEAFEVIKQAKNRYPDARHHCWAFIACPPLNASTVRFSDSGEPAGTAGKAILNVLQYSHYGEIICVVSRYFGGIKLGTGGLGRAYSNSTQAALKKLSVRKVSPLSAIQIQFPYPFESSIRHYLAAIDINIAHINYQEQVIFQIDIEPLQIKQIMQQARNLCKGEVLLIETNNSKLKKY